MNTNQALIGCFLSVAAVTNAPKTPPIRLQPLYKFTQTDFEGSVHLKIYKHLEQQKEINLALNRIASLPTNWDGYSAPSISESVINRVKGFFSEIKFTNKIFPTSRNSIQIEYEKDNGEYLEVEFFSDKIIALQIANDEEIEYPNLSAQVAKKLIASFA